MSVTDERILQFYVVGGTMPPDAPSYVARPADRELYERVLKGELCYILTTRQVGKSSLMTRTAKRLHEDGVRVAVVELTTVGAKSVEAERWYFGVAESIADSLKLEVDLEKWWDQHERLPVSQRVVRLLRDVVLAGTDDRVVIFLDEIDSTLSLPFTDDFFAALRACHNLRAAEPDLRRLSFVLLGAASPSDLIAEPSRTPFNVGTRLELQDFTEEEAKVLARGLGEDKRVAESALTRIFYWTDGHPYLTQKLCALTRDHLESDVPEGVVDRLVEEHFLSPGSERTEDNLRFVGDRLSYHPHTARRVLERYRKIRSSPHGQREKPQSLIDMELKLTGLIKPLSEGRLVVRNRIYREVFDRKWIREVIPADVSGRLFVALLGLLIASVIFWYEVLYPLQLSRDLKQASLDVKQASDSYHRLREVPFYSGRAGELFAEFCEQRSKQVGGRDAKLLWSLEALVAKPTEARRRAVSLLLDPRLQRTLRYDLSDLAGEPARPPLLRVALNPQGTSVATGNSQGVAQRWDVLTGRPQGRAMRHGGPVYAVAFHPDGKIVVTGGKNGAAIWRESEPEPKRLAQHGGDVFIAAFSPDGESLLTGSADRTARLWSARTGEFLAEMQHPNEIFSACFSFDGRMILTATGSVRISDREVETSGEGRVRLWSTASGRLIKTFDRQCSGYCSAVFTPDGEKILIIDLEWWALVDVQSGRSLAAVPHFSPAFTAAFSREGQQLLTSDVRLALSWDARTLEPTHPPLEHGSLVMTVAFGAEDHQVLTSTRAGIARFWDLTANENQPASAAVLEMSPEELRRSWQEKLNLRIDDGGELSPLTSLVE